MNLARLLRTARYLTAEQLLYSVVRRARHAHWQRQPGRARARIAAAAARLPMPDPRRPALGRIADNVALIQQTIHAESPAKLREGRLRIYGRVFSVRGWEHLDWRHDAGEGNSPLRRLTLAYFGWAVPLLAEGRADDLRRLATAIGSLETVPWSEPGVFRDLWNPYTASHRLINLLCALHLYCRGGGAMEPAHASAVLDHVRRCAALIAHDPERDIQANHLFKNWTALATYAAATAVPEGLFPRLTEGIRHGLDQLVLPDGGHAERSPMYHALGLIDVDILLASGAMPTLEGRLREAAEKMRHALGVLTHPDGEIALFNDAWLGGAPPPAMLGAVPPKPGSHSLAASGYVRLDGGGDVAIFDSGPCALDCQPGHAHADFLSFELSISGQRFIVDPGTATYTSGELRDRTRSAASHNGPHVEGHEPLELWQSFRVGRRGSAGVLHGADLDSLAPLWCAGWQSGYRHLGVDVRRWLGLWPGRGLVVIDIWSGAKPQFCRSRFLVPGSWDSQMAGDTIRFRGGAAGEVDARSVIGTLGPGQHSAWWPRYGEEMPATAFDVRPASLGGLPTAALLIGWSSSPPAPPRDALERVAHAMVAAEPIAVG